MDLTIDILSFEKVDVECYGMHIGAKILINGEVLLDKVKVIEEPYAIAEGHPNIAGGYEHQIAKSLYKQLTGEWVEPNGVALFTCECLEDGCWSLRVEVQENENEVIWCNIRHEHRDKWDYSALGSFRFNKTQYLNELEKLKSFWVTGD